MSDYGIIISDKDSDVKSLEKILFTTKYATAKLDTTNQASFSNITLRFINDPPEPGGGGGTATTRVGIFEHGYDYKPSYWSLIQVVLATSSNYAPYFQEQGNISSQTITDDTVIFRVSADEKNIYFNIDKTNTGLGSPNNITGMILRIRLYVFAEDVGI